MSPGAASHPIDDLMERASTALVRGDYFAAERLCKRALTKAIAGGEWERAARVCMPLQEARRQKRLLAIDAMRGMVNVVAALETGERLAAGCYLLQPPLVALDARHAREAADEREVPIFVLTREPITRAGLWPVAAVYGPLSLRVRLAPPAGVKAVAGGPGLASPTGDETERPVPVDWFVAAGEALGDSAIAKLNPADPAAHQAMDLADALEAFPDHEKLHQKLEEVCRRAAVEPPPAFPRRRPTIQDPYSF